MISYQVSKLFLVALILATVGLAGCHEVRVSVHGEDGEPIVGAVVDVHFVQRRAPGTGWGGGGSRTVSRETGQAGRARIRGRASAGYATVGVGNEGYYRSRERVALGVMGREELNFVLRTIENPIPMYARRVTAHIPVEDEAVGFDLMVADWVAPHGGGEVSDIMFAISRGGEEVVEMMGPHNRKRIYYDATLAIEFQGRGAGAQVIPEDKMFLQSAYIWPYEAPFAGYESRFVRRKKRSDEGSESNVDNDLHYFIKVRPIYDDNGVIQTVHYGKIRGDFDFNPLQSGNNQITFTYYLNPEPNSRNIEFDPQQNLFGELPPAEHVRAP